MKRLFITCFTCMIVACSSNPDITVPDDVASLDNVTIYSGDEAPLQTVSLEREARFGDTGDVYIGSVSGVAVSDDGTLYLADQGGSIVHVYSSSGEYITAIGAKGEGPGEFQSVSAPRLFDDELYVLDGQQRRLSVFDTDELNYMRSHPLGNSGGGISGFPLFAQPLPGNQFLVIQNSIQRDGETFYMRYIPTIFDADGDTVRTEFVTFQRNPMHTVQSDNSIRLTSLDFMGHTHIAFTTDYELVSGYSDRFLFHIISLNGDTLRSIYHGVTPPLIDRNEMLANFEDEAMRKDIAKLDIPDRRPAYESFFIDDENRFWVEVLTEDMDVNKWWILAENGEKLAEFDHPATSRIMAVKDEYVYFLETDEETGYRDVVKYRVVFREA